MSAPGRPGGTADQGGAGATASRVRRNVLRLALGYSSSRIARFLAAVVMARALSTADFGIVNAVVAAAGLMAQVASFGITDVGSREIAASSEDADRLVGRVLSIRMLVLGLSVPVLLLAAVLADWSLAVVAAGVVMAFALASSTDWALRGLERMDAVARLAAAGGATVLATMLLLFPVGPYVVLAAGAFALGEIVSAALAWRFLRGSGIRPRFGLEGAGRFVRSSWKVAVAGFVAYLYFSNADALLLIAFRGPEETGLYSAAYRLFLAAATISLLAAWSLMPALARRLAPGADGDEEDARLPTAWLLLGYGGLVLGGAELAGEQVLEAVFGSEFGSMATVLTVLCIGVAWYSVGYPIGYGSIADQEPNRLLPGAITAGLLNLGLGLALIPGNGPEGAAWATAIALAVGSLVWLIQSRLTLNQSVAVVTALVAITVGGVLSVAAPATATAVGIVTLVAALAVLALRAEIGFVRGRHP